MKKCCLFLIIISASIWGQQKQITISGKVTDGTAPIPDVNISVPNSEKGTRTDAEGFYKISLDEGSLLVYSHLGYESVEIVTEDVDRTLNIVIIPIVNQLDNVTVIKTKPRKTQKELFSEYNTNPNLIKTMFGILDKETIGFSLRILDTEDLNVWYPDLSYLLNNRFAQVRSVCNRETGLLETSMREVITLGLAGGNSSIYEVDGVVYESLPCELVDVTNIKRIAVIPSFAGLTKYGTLAKGGVIIINTKTGNFSPGSNGIPNYDQAKIRNNVYDNSALQTPIDEAKLRSTIYSSTLVSKKLGAENPNYLNRLLESKNEMEAKGDLRRSKEDLWQYAVLYFRRL